MLEPPVEVSLPVAPAELRKRSALRKRTAVAPAELVQEIQPGLARSTTSAVELWQKGRRKIMLSRALANKNAGDAILIEQDMTSMPILACTSHDFITKLAVGVLSVPYKEGELIVRQGATGTSLILVLRGKVDVMIGKEKVGELTNGQYFGETNLIGLECTWTVTMIAHNRCEICEITRDHWDDTLAGCPDQQRFFADIRIRNVSCMMDGTLTKTCKILHGLSERTLHSVDLHLVRRLYFPGERILVEGQPGDEFYILVKGRATVIIAGRPVRSEACGAAAGEDAEIGSKPDDAKREGTKRQQTKRLSLNNSSDPVCFGELGFFGLQETRSATVVAATICQVRVLFRAVFLQSLHTHGESLRLSEMQQFLQKRYNTDDSHSATSKMMRLRDVKFFDQDCSDDFLEFLAKNLEDRVFLKGQKVWPEDNSLYILLGGSVDVLRNGMRVTSQPAGAVIGEIPALGLGSKDSSTFEAVETCYIQVLHQSVIIRALELCPSDRQKVLMMTFDKFEDDEDKQEVVEPPRDPLRRRGTLKLGMAQVQRRKTVCMQAAEVERQNTWKSKTHRAFMRAMQKSQLFANVSTAFLEHLSSVSVDRIYMPGDHIIEEGKRGDSMFIMVSGTAGVFTSDEDRFHGTQPNFDGRKNSKPRGSTGLPSAQKSAKIGMLTPGSISGELAMLGVSQTRSATIQAETLCSMWEITQENALSILSAFPEANRQFTEIVLNRLERTAPSCILQLPLLQHFDRKFRMLVGLYCEKRAYFPGQVIVQEGKNGDGMYVVNMGRATLEKKSVTIKTYTPGMHLCSTVMLGLHKTAIGSLLAMQTCHILVITHTSFGLALEKYPCHQTYQDLKQSEIEEYAEFSNAVQRISARKLVWRRYQNFQSAAADPQGKSEETKISDQGLQRQTIQVWKKYAAQSKKRRARARANKQRAEEWITRKREAVEKRLAQDLVQTQARNACTRDSFELTPFGHIARSNPDLPQMRTSFDSDDSCRSPSRSQSPPGIEEQAAATAPVSARLPRLVSPRQTARPSPFAEPLRATRRSRSPTRYAILPALVADTGKKGGADVNEHPAVAANHEVNADNSAVMTSGCVAYDAYAPDASRLLVKRGMPFSLDDAGDLRGGRYMMLNSIGANGTNIIWSGKGV